MSFFSNVSTRSRAQPSAKVVAREPDPSLNELNLYRELIAQRPALLDEKLKLHERIIDEFNLASLEKLPREDIARVLNKKPGALRVTLFRALNALREDLARRGVRP